MPYHGGNLRPPSCREGSGAAQVNIGAVSEPEPEPENMTQGMGECRVWGGIFSQRRKMTAVVMLCLAFGDFHLAIAQTTISQIVNDGLSGLNTPGLSGKPFYSPTPA
jgi:hypothetical protein